MKVLTKAKAAKGSGTSLVLLLIETNKIILVIAALFFSLCATIEHFFSIIKVIKTEKRTNLYC
jgi:hypothetical protein